MSAIHHDSAVAITHGIERNGDRKVEGSNFLNEVLSEKIAQMPILREIQPFVLYNAFCFIQLQLFLKIVAHPIDIGRGWL